MIASSNISSMSNANVGKAFNAIVKGIGRNDIGEILVNWSESQLNMDGDKIIGDPGRGGIFSNFVKLMRKDTDLTSKTARHRHVRSW